MEESPFSLADRVALVTGSSRGIGLGLAEALGPDFELVESRREVHRTPWGSEQPFTYGLFRRVAPKG